MSAVNGETEKGRAKRPSTPRAARSPDQTRARLIRAAEHEMARHGIEGADLNRINVAAGQRNSSAIHYHFGSRRGLVDAIYASHREPINHERNAILDRLERRAAGTLEALVGAMVQPIARRLDDQSRRDYIIILAEGSTRLGTTGLYEAEQPYSDSLRRMNNRLVHAIDGPVTTRRIRVGQANLAAIVFLADIARDIHDERLSIARGRRRVRGVIEAVHGGLIGPGGRNHHPVGDLLGPARDVAY